jgi:hypothetical protein
LEREVVAVLLAAHGAAVGAADAAWLEENLSRKSSLLLSALVESRPELLDLAARAWAAAAGMPPMNLTRCGRWVEPNRHCTLMFYLNDDFEGGETSFPDAPGTTLPPIDRPGVPQCSRGVYVTPVARAGALFYHKTGDGVNDRLSLHAGCPPTKGTKWSINGFMWNQDADSGPRNFN